MDLAQAEAVADLIDARSAPAATLALGHLEGRLSRSVEALYARTTDMLVLLEAAIDFSEEGGTALDAGDWAARIGEILAGLRTLLGTYDAGRIRREGLRVVIVGRPNSAKSSLLNRLLGEERAIVTPIPGTTRDFIEETLLIEGIPVRLTDTAGIRTPGDAIERAGIAMVRQRLSHADAVLLLLDGSAPLTPEDEALLGEARERPTVIAVNKADLPHVLAGDRLRAFRPVHPPLWISAKTGEGIDALKALLYAACGGGEPATRDGALVGNLRHKLALEAAQAHLERGGEGLERGVSPEFIALDVRDALHSLGEVTGETASPEILDKIFAGFCVGK
jgi:tRNA modification GTPase